MFHDHSKLDPLIDAADESIRKRDYQSFSDIVEKCIDALRAHVKWENGEKGILHEIEEKHPELSEDIIELRNDHLFLIQKLKRAYHFAKDEDAQAFVLFERFKIRRKEHVFHEDELDVMIHTIQLKK